MTDLSVGVIGLGNMGGTLATRFVNDGITVTGFDTDPAALDAAIAVGVDPADSTADLVPDRDVIVTSLPDPETVRTVYLGEGGILSSLSGHAVALEMSTIDPGTSRAIADAAAGQPLEVLDAPVSGGVGRAETGDLTVMIGGDEAVLDRPDVQRVLGAVGSDIHYAGGSGAGHTLKLLNNMIAMGTGLVAMEVAALAAELDVDWRVFMDVIGRSSGSSYAFRKGMPRVLNRDFAATFTLELARKDAQLALRMADAVDFPAPIAAAAYQRRIEAVSEGLGDEGVTAVVKLYEAATGSRVEAAEPIDEDYLSWLDKP